MEQQSEANGDKHEELNQQGILQDSQYQTNADREMWDEYIAWCIKQENSTHEKKQKQKAKKKQKARQASQQYTGKVLIMSFHIKFQNSHETPFSQRS